MAGMPLERLGNWSGVYPTTQQDIWNFLGTKNFFFVITVLRLFWISCNVKLCFLLLLFWTSRQSALKNSMKLPETFAHYCMCVFVSKRNEALKCTHPLPWIYSCVGPSARSCARSPAAWCPLAGRSRSSTLGTHRWGTPLTPEALREGETGHGATQPDRQHHT